MRTFSKATEARSAVVAGQTEGRMACQAHAAPLLYVHPHPTAARRAAALASSEREMHIGARTSSDRFRGVLRHEKKPEGYTSTPTGLKRLRTQITAFHVNANGKGTPSGVPQPIHKRKLILVEEEFDASSFGGGAENRTPVHNSPLGAFSKLSHQIVSMPASLTTRLPASNRFSLSLRHTDYVRRGSPVCGVLPAMGTSPRVDVAAN